MRADDRVEVSIFGETHIPSVERRLNFGAQFLLDAASMIYAAFKVEAPELIALKAQLAKLRAKHGAESPPSDSPLR